MTLLNSARSSAALSGLGTIPKKEINIQQRRNWSNKEIRRKNCWGEKRQINNINIQQESKWSTHYLEKVWSIMIWDEKIVCCLTQPSQKAICQRPQPIEGRSGNVLLRKYIQSNPGIYITCSLRSQIDTIWFSSPPPFFLNLNFPP